VGHPRSSPLRFGRACPHTSMVRSVESPTLADLKARAERGRRILGTASVDENHDSQVAGADGVKDLDNSAELAPVETDTDLVGD
jgi:hypothetical protein